MQTHTGRYLCDVHLHQRIGAAIPPQRLFERSLSDLYDPISMPPALVRAHADLDRAVDLCYRPQPFDNDRQRVEFLFALYEKLTAPLLPAAKSPGKRSRRPSPA